MNKMIDNKVKLVALSGPLYTDLIYIKNELLKDKKTFAGLRRVSTDQSSDKEVYTIVSKEKFAQELLSNQIIEAYIDKEECYGTRAKDFYQNKINVEIFTPYSLNALIENKNIDLFIIYLETSDKILLQNLLIKEKNLEADEIIELYNSNKKIFRNFIEEYEPEVIINNKSKVSICIEAIKAWATS